MLKHNYGQFFLFNDIDFMLVTFVLSTKKEYKNMYILLFIDDLNINFLT